MIIRAHYKYIEKIAKKVFRIDKFHHLRSNENVIDRAQYKVFKNWWKFNHFWNKKRIPDWQMSPFLRSNENVTKRAQYKFLKNRWKFNDFIKDFLSHFWSYNRMWLSVPIINILKKLQKKSSELTNFTIFVVKWECD